MTFCSIVGHASFQTAGRMGPSTRLLSKDLPFFGLLARGLRLWVGG